MFVRLKKAKYKSTFPYFFTWTMKSTYEIIIKTVVEFERKSKMFFYFLGSVGRFELGSLS